MVGVSAEKSVVARIGNGAIRPEATRTCVALVPRAFVPVRAVQRRSTDTHTGSTRVGRRARISVVTRIRVVRVLASKRDAAEIIRTDIRVSTERVICRMHAHIGVVVARIVGAAEAITAVHRCTGAHTTPTHVAHGAVKSVVARNRVVRECAIQGHVADIPRANVSVVAQGMVYGVRR